MKLMQLLISHPRFTAACIFGIVVLSQPPLLASAADTTRLSETQQRILSEVESRWWGWPAKASRILPAPKSCQIQPGPWAIQPGSAIEVITAPGASAQESYIAGMICRELTGKHRLQCRTVEAGSMPETRGLAICVAGPNCAPWLASLVRAAGIQRESPSRPEGYSIEFTEDAQSGRRWVLIVGDDPVGCIHGGFTFLQLVRTESGRTTFQPAAIRDYPDVAVRSLRGVGEALGMKLQTHTWSSWFRRNVTADEIHPDDLMLPCLDWLARNRINCFHVLAGLKNPPQLPARLRHLVTEAHRRGIKVVGGFRPVGGDEGDTAKGRTHPCYCSEEDMQKVPGFYRQYIEAGCDFLYFMADDYEKAKLAGHCPQCIARFGGLAGEQQFMLHRILDLARERGFPASHVLFCPTHYDIRGGTVPEAYLDVFDRDPRLREVQFTFTYVTEAQIAERKRRFPHLRYAL
ncbi:MAG: hypothetical protein FJ388_17990, partial [Verrucomicrobia bacterium]|nr:hypothetical protein [Verrucomicrobiota bacterium]